jgi:hypothetical protein
LQRIVACGIRVWTWHAADSIRPQPGECKPDRAG